MNLIAGSLLAMGVVLALTAAIGVAFAPNYFARLHYLSLASLLPPLLTTAAVMLSRPTFASALKSTLIMLILLVSGPLIVHLLARAGRLRERREAPL